MYMRNKFLRSFIAVLPRSYATKRSQASLDTNDEVGASFFAKHIGSNYWKWHAALHKHPELKTLKSKDILNSAKALNKLDFTVDDILTRPMILYTNEMTLENRYVVLKECGFVEITIPLLSKFVAAMNRSVVSLKSFRYISYDTDVVERLRTTFSDVDVTLSPDLECNESLELKLLRQRILNCYLRQKLGASSNDIEKIWKTYGRLRHKSFSSIQSVIEVLTKDLKFSYERIIKNAFLLYADACNVKRIIKEVPTIDGQDIKELLYKRPKIMMTSCDGLLTTMQHIREFGIEEGAILRCLEILTLGPDTVLERLKDLNEVEEFQVLSSNPRVLRLVHYQNKARLRLDYLNQLKVRCASLHILSCSSEAFARFARDGSDKTKGRDVVVYLSNVMNKNESDLRNLLSRHPNWCHIPAIQVKQCYEFLIENKFCTQDIYNNIHMLLYPIKRIEEKLKQLNTTDFIKEIKSIENCEELTQNEVLTLVLYLIESEFHFTGDGIWTEQHTQHVENFNNLLPDFPESLNKIYKYGLKSGSASISSKKESKDSFKEYVFN
ncbi:transcription termination factor 5, mitochondrial-like [Musca domestica]|uniref:Transcription termination factor 5, mitochondrial-like n=1 Tax=Musca domestica TaxID=7370 RepID=A0ABM3UKW4_MUSDO|nr:transcription termination factor 5, mitochondrial-like [Musca domestica]